MFPPRNSISSWKQEDGEGGLEEIISHQTNNDLLSFDDPLQAQSNVNQRQKGYSRLQQWLLPFAIFYSLFLISFVLQKDEVTE